MAHCTVINKLAQEVLAVDGVAGIGKLRVDAAALHRIGNAASAETLLDIADAAAENGSAAR